MSNETNTRKQRQILVASSILESVGINIEELRFHLVELKSILGPKFEQLIPDKINDFPSLHWVISLNLRLQKLKHCTGFSRHIARYAGKQIKASYFVSGVASYLYDRIDNLELEPYTSQKRMADILTRYRDEEIYLECKDIAYSKFNYTEEHEHMFSILREYLSDVMHQISITYKKQLSDTELHELGQSLQKRAKSIRADGTIIDNPDISVKVIRKDTTWDKRIHVHMIIIEEDLNERCRYPGDVYNIDGISMSISGPKVDYKRVIRERIRRGKRQYHEAKPYILVIDSSDILGSLIENIRAISTAFQPVVNTRFSAVVLVESRPVIGSTRTDFAFHFVTNPFAKFPISKNFELLFKNSKE